MRLRLLALALLAGTALAGGAVADDRVALVVSNNAYSPLSALENPHRDAQLIAAGLKDAGFTKVIEARDLNRTQFAARLEEFKREAGDAEVALIYFAGHGLEVDRVNYLAPVDAAVRALNDVPNQLISLDRLKASVGGAKRLKILIMDACRKDEFEELFAGQQGLRTGNAATRNSETGMIVAFAAAEGQVASDGVAGAANSPFADALARRLGTPGIEIGNLFRVVHDDVRAATNSSQSPAIYASLSAEPFYFVAPPVDAPAGLPAADREAKSQAESELEFWKAVTELGEAELYQTYLDKVRTGEFKGTFKEVAAARIRTLPKSVPDAPPPEPAQLASASAPPAAPAAPVRCSAGAKIEVLWEGKWFPATVRADQEADGQCPIAYDGYAASWNESVRPERWRAPQPKAAAAAPLSPEHKAKYDEWKAAVAAGQAAMAAGSLSDSAREFERASRAAGSVPSMRQVAGATALIAGTNYYLEGGAKGNMQAMRMYRRAAAYGDSGAAVLYAYMLRLGHGVAKDETRARAVLKPFAEAGEGDAMAQYGQMLMLGQGGPRDERAGRKYLEEAAKEGAPAGMYHWGELVRRDQGDAPAALWFRRAAEKDNTRAMVALGRILLWSDKVPRNVEEGTKWLQKASDGFEFEASYELARFYIADPDPKNREKGLALAQKAALSRNADHALFYADLLRGGRAGPQDFKQARLWYENAASNGNRYQRRRAQLELASLAGR